MEKMIHSSKIFMLTNSAVEKLPKVLNTHELSFIQYMYITVLAKTNGEHTAIIIYK